MTVGIEEPHHPFRLLKGLDQAVQQKSIEASIAESNAILVVLVEGVPRDLPCGAIPGAYSSGRLSFYAPAKTCRPKLSRLAGVAQSAPVRAGGLRSHGQLPQTGNLCSSAANRAAVSVPANIAEGFRRRGKADKARFMNMAEGSLEESRYYLILAQDLGYAETAKLASALEEVSRLLSAYAAAILTSDS